MQYSEKHLMRSYVNINLVQLQTNLNRLRALLILEPMAVVKADAYGHGDRVVAKFLSDNSIRHFAVSNIDEAIRIREAGAEGQILILGYTPTERTEELVRFDITQAILSEAYAERLAKQGMPVKCQFAIDTGMRRIGLNADDPDHCERVIRKTHSTILQLDGLFTHLCVADTPEQDEFTNHQISLFENIVSRVFDLHLPYCHCMNSAGGLWHHSDVSCFARLGIILYGLKPDYMNKLPEGIEPVLPLQPIFLTFASPRRISFSDSARRAWKKSAWRLVSERHTISHRPSSL